MNDVDAEQEMKDFIAEKEKLVEKLTDQIGEIIIKENYDPAVAMKAMSIITSFYIIECKDLDLALKVFAMTFDSVAKSKGKSYELSIQSTE